MIARLAALLKRGTEALAPAADEEDTDKELAVAALLVEAALMDDHFEPEERETIARLLARQFDIGETAAEALITEAEAAVTASPALYRFTRVINDTYSPEERVGVIEMLWTVALADGEVHDYEANLLRRVGGLIYVSDRDNGRARKRAMERLGIS
jgi:uncharacterized tellurite resistance protein B-like protein